MIVGNSATVRGINIPKVNDSNTIRPKFESYRKGRTPNVQGKWSCASCHPSSFKGGAEAMHGAGATSGVEPWITMGSRKDERFPTPYQKRWCVVRACRVFPRSARRKAFGETAIRQIELHIEFASTKGER